MVSSLWSEQWPDLQIQTETYRSRLRPADPDWDLQIQTKWSVYCGVSSDLQIQTETYTFRLNSQFIVEWTVTYRSRLRPTHSDWMVGLLWSEQWPTDSDWDLQIQTETYRFRLNGQFTVEWAMTYRFRLRPTDSDQMVSLLWSEQWPTDPYWDLHIHTEWSVHWEVSSDLQIQTETYTFRLNILPQHTKSTKGIHFPRQQEHRGKGLSEGGEDPGKSWKG